MKRFVFPLLLTSTAAAGLALLAPSEAEACGGTFCDGGPQPMPVDQSGENIAFIRDGSRIEAHIQIQYEGEAERFGWVIPLQSVPEFSVGSEPFFQALLNASVPTYGITNQFDDCSFDDDMGGGGAPDPGDNAGGTGGAGDDGGEGGGPDILLMETVGAFEITVLTAGSAQEVIDWLDENGYQQDPDAEPILQEYLDEGHVFGAVKLTGGVDVDEIHPIVLRFESNEPCIPLRLTRIAAKDDMDVRTFFLGDSRVVPRTYRHVEVNPLKIDWLGQGINYKEVISMAVDAQMAGGRAFVTEYAGDSSVADPFLNMVFNESWNGEAYDGIEVTQVVDVLESQGLFFCDEFYTCGAQHPLVQPLLDEFVPLPPGIDYVDFYSDLEAYVDEIDMEAWDADAFADAMRERVIKPGRQARKAIEDNPYLTRMYTTISPHEMMEDPMFHENDSLDDVAAARTGTRRFLCNGDSVFTLPDGREVYLPAGTTEWPDFEDEPAWAQPWEEEVAEIMTEGAPLVLTNRTDEIDTALMAYNAAHDWPGGGLPGDDDDDDGATSGGGDDDDDDDDDDDAGQSDEAGSDGCGCRTSSPMGALWALAFGFGLVAARRRRD